MPIRGMLDTDNLDDLDGHAELLATYADLVTSQLQLDQLRRRFPDSELVFFDRGLGDPLDIATIADVEPLAMTIGQLPGWTARKRAAGKRYLTGYCDRNDLAAVQAIMGHGLYHGVATLDGTCHVGGFQPLHGPAFVQILGSDHTGIHANLSLVLEDGWHPRVGYLAEEAIKPILT